MRVLLNQELRSANNKLRGAGATIHSCNKNKNEMQHKRVGQPYYNLPSAHLQFIKFCPPFYINYTM